MADTYYVTVAPHNSNGPISTVASLHFDMSIPNCHMQELFLNSVDLYQEVLTNPIEIADGYATPPAGPGWGTDIDDAVLAKYRNGQGFESYDKLAPEDRNRLKGPVTALAEDLSTLRGTLGID